MGVFKLNDVFADATLINFCTKIKSSQRPYFSIKELSMLVEQNLTGFGMLAKEIIFNSFLELPFFHLSESGEVTTATQCKNLLEIEKEMIIARGLAAHFEPMECRNYSDTIDSFVYGWSREDIISAVHTHDFFMSTMQLRHGKGYYFLPESAINLSQDSHLQSIESGKVKDAQIEALQAEIKQLQSENDRLCSDLKESQSNNINAKSEKSALQIIAVLGHMAKVDCSAPFKAYEAVQLHADTNGLSIPNKDTFAKWVHKKQ